MVSSVSLADQKIGSATSQNAARSSTALESVVVAQPLRIALKIAGHGAARRARFLDLIERPLEMTRQKLRLGGVERATIPQPQREGRRREKQRFEERRPIHAPSRRTATRRAPRPRAASIVLKKRHEPQCKQMNFKYNPPNLPNFKYNPATDNRRC